jgi:hypothetical protein
MSAGRTGNMPVFRWAASHRQKWPREKIFAASDEFTG